MIDKASQTDASYVMELKAMLDKQRVLLLNK
jgi:hypothetical protein